MKKSKIIVTAIAGGLALTACIAAHYIQKAKDRLYRMAAGESPYERKHKKK